MFDSSSALPRTPSLTRKPAASAKSSPGVRMVMASGFPFSRISSGSSVTSVSGRSLTAPSRMRMTRRRAVTRPMSISPVRPIRRVPSGVAPGGSIVLYVYKEPRCGPRHRVRNAPRRRIAPERPEYGVESVNSLST